MHTSDEDIVNPGKICRLAAIEEIAISIVIGQICVIKPTPVARLLIHAFYIGLQQAGDSLAGDLKNRKRKVGVEPTIPVRKWLPTQNYFPPKSVKSYVAQNHFLFEIPSRREAYVQLRPRTSPTVQATGRILLPHVHSLAKLIERV
jgi:hypothetical protein